MIVWLASYPRSGNTFLRILLQRYFGLHTLSKYDDASDIGADEKLTELVGHDLLKAGWDDVYPQLSRSPDLHCVKTHDHPEDEEKAIYVLRDPRAVTVSYRRYLENYGYREPDFLDVITGSVGFGAWSDHVKAWAPLSRPDTLFLKFEDMCATPETTVAQIGEFLGLPAQAAENVDFNELRKVAPKFFRTGSNEQNIGELDANSLALINSLYQDEMIHYGYPVTEPQNQEAIRLAMSEIGCRLSKSRYNAHQTETRLVETKEIVAKTKTEFGELEDALIQAHQLRDERSGTIEQQQKQLTQMSQELAELRSQELSQQEANEGLRTELQTLRRELQDAHKKVATLKEELTRSHDELKEQTAQLSEMISRQKAAYEKAETRFEASQKAHLDSQRDLKIKEAEAEHARLSEAALAEEMTALKQQLSSAQERLGTLHGALAPRWQTILTLKPLRFAYRLRQQVKAGHLKLDAHGLPYDEEMTVPLPANGTDASPETVPAPEHLPNGTSRSFYAGWVPEKPLGIAVFAYDRAQNLEAVLESLKLQDALAHTHVFIDGDQGRPAKKQVLDQTEEIARRYDVAAIHRQRGNFGFRKMMVVSIKRMFDMYEHALFLEDDCFPTRDAARGISCELSGIEAESDIFSVYGHHFGLEEGADRFSRFQGWGWASTREKMMSIWPELRDVYLMDEEAYLTYIANTLKDEVKTRLDVTPGRNPSDTLTKFFAWDETLALLTAVKGLNHRPSKERLIYNFGVGHGSTHFAANPVFREPPFNMIFPDEIWSHF